VYKTFFHLQRDPFEISPDPHFIYPAARHNEALANLYYAILGRKGFVAITGEVGTGKTLLVRCLLERLQKHRVRFAYVFNPLLGPVEFLRYLTADLRLGGNWSDKSAILQALHAFLLESHMHGSSTVLVVDEAHLLSEQVLEEIRLLGNLETTNVKLLQIALVGQPELDKKLDAPGLRQLKQRIALRCSLQPLNLEDTQKYVQWRLNRAGAKANSGIFSEDTLVAVYRYSRGIPRLINTICENSLVSAYAEGVQSVSVRLVKEVCQDLRLDVVPESPHREGPSFEMGEELELAIRRVFEDLGEILVVEAAQPSSQKPVPVQPAEELAIDKVFHNWEKKPMWQ
jgi:general secretion pathway protein A